MRINRQDLERQARTERALIVGTWIATGIAAVWKFTARAADQFVSKAWRSSSSSGMNSKALS
jgi:hypothetical protein